jgi:hypothetical protein
MVLCCDAFTLLHACLSLAGYELNAPASVTAGSVEIAASFCRFRLPVFTLISIIPKRVIPKS